MKHLFILLFAFFYCHLAFAQERIVYGVVTEPTGYPIPGANVLVEGTKNTTQTDFDGCYSIKVKPEQHLIFSYFGFKTQKKAAAAYEINVVLQEEKSDLREVYPVFYTLKKKDFKNALKVIPPEEIKKGKN
ncbi:carboxypeptidase-like regulatory domain-containing protein [Flavobacterium gelatinilyticum]|uniref:carboxypeptidase-like regulatory domain-containing protein n=1 Tax=Flavobacterium gelatinilyticum TaxID=3003260 RepID=UPI00247FBAD9|nr:carboxypeptidase-like regulatory domain-containing protein [Flavobacterium gelatinilyticum]